MGFPVVPVVVVVALAVVVGGASSRRRRKSNKNKVITNGRVFARLSGNRVVVLLYNAQDENADAFVAEFLALAPTTAKRDPLKFVAISASVLQPLAGLADIEVTNRTAIVAVHVSAKRSVIFDANDINDLKTNVEKVFEFFDGQRGN